MIERLAKEKVISALRSQAAVAILGPRQIGKTTLAREIGKGFNAEYLDLERSEARIRLHDPWIYLTKMEDRLVILDEVHHMPDLFNELRGIIDEGRRKGLGNARFLLLGSASIDLLHQSESLAGRISYVPLSTLSPLEVGQSQDERQRLWLRGGFPSSYVANSDAESFRWRKDFISTYLSRDVAMFGPRIPAATLERFWMMLAHRQGSVLNESDLARAMEVSATSISRYIDLLCDLLLVRRLHPFSVNVGKRLVKRSKVYVRDSGLVHALLNISDFGSVMGHPVSGFSWEGFVIESIVNLLEWPAKPWFYRTADGAEIDLVLEFAPGKTWAVEIKRGMAATLEKGFRNALQDIKPERAFIVHAGDDRYPVAEGIEAIGIHEFCRLVTNEK